MRCNDSNQANDANSKIKPSMMQDGTLLKLRAKILSQTPNQLQQIKDQHTQFKVKDIIEL